MRCTKCGVVVLQASMLNCGGNLSGIYVHRAISETYWCNGFTDIYASLEVGGVNLPWVYVHCAIYETYLV